MRYLAGFTLVILCAWRITAWCFHLLEFDAPKVERYDCKDRGYAVIVNGEQVACTGDGPSTSTWIPNHGPKDIPLQPIKIPDDSWMDAHD